MGRPEVRPAIYQRETLNFAGIAVKSPLAETGSDMMSADHPVFVCMFKARPLRRRSAKGSFTNARHSFGFTRFVVFVPRPI